MKKVAALVIAISVAIFLGGASSGSANTPPVAVCQDVEVLGDSDGGCSADADVDDGSWDPDGDSISYTYEPAGPYDYGGTEVTLTVTDPDGESDSCTGIVTVADVEAPVVDCNVPFHGLTPRSAPISFTATAVDNCDPEVDIEISDQFVQCIWTNPAGQTFDRTDRCPVTINPVDTVNLGTPLIPFTSIEWVTRATDDSGNQLEQVCSVLVTPRIWTKP